MRTWLVFLLCTTVCLGWGDPISDLQRKVKHASNAEKPALLLKLASLVESEDIPQSIDYLKEALRIAQEEGLDADVPIALENIGDAYRRINSYSIALEYYIALLNFAQAVNDETLKALAHQKIGISYNNLAVYDKAIEHLETSIRIQEEHDLVAELPDSYLNCGNVYKNLGSYEQAETYYRKALELFKLAGNKNGVARGLNNIGLIFKYQAQYDVALDYYFQSLKIKEELGKKRLIGSTLNNIAGIYHKMDNHAASLQYYNQAYQMFEDIGDMKLMCSVLNNVAGVYKEQKDFAKAQQTYKEALKLSKKIGYARVSASAYNNLALLYKEQGQLQEAREYYQAALQLVESQGSRNGIIHCLINLGGLYLEEKNFPQARQCFERTLRIAQEIGSKLMVQNAYSALYELYDALGDSDKKLDYYQKYTAIKDSIAGEDLKAQIAELRLKYESEKASRELELLRKDNEIYRLDIERNKLFRQLMWLAIFVVVLIAVFIFVRYRMGAQAQRRLQQEVDERQYTEDQLRTAKRDLNMRVLQRTEDLARINASLQEEIAARKKAEEHLRIKNVQLTNVMQETVRVLLHAMDMRDAHTALHQRRVEQLAVAIARDLQLAEERINSVRFAALLHDIGKLSIPVEILRKEEPLNQYEEGLIQTHPGAGAEILQNIDFPWPVQDIVLQHHEEYDGSGYPCGLKGADIMLEARILHVADVATSLTEHHSFRPAVHLQDVLLQIQAGAGTRFDPLVAESCLNLFRSGSFSFND